MKKVLFLALVLMAVLVTSNSYGAEIFRHGFFDEYDPATTSFVYNQAGSGATGDQVAVNTYLQKTIQITAVAVNENIDIRIEGRSKDQKNQNPNSSNWAVLDVVQFGSASDDTSQNVIVDVTEYVDFLRIGIKRHDTSTGISSIDIRGIFTNLER